MSGQFYKYKSGSQKRKIQAAREAKETVGRQSITKYFKKDIENVENIVAMSESNPNATASTVEPSTSLDMIDSQKKEDSQEAEFQLNLNSKNNCQTDDPALNTSKLEANPKPFNANVKFDDPGTWPGTITDQLRQLVVTSYTGFDAIENLSRKFSVDCNGKKFQKSQLYSKTVDRRTRHQFPREWLLWSATEESLHCLPCKLFSIKATTSMLVKEGFSPKTKAWKRLYNILPKHENNPVHKANYLQWKSLELSLKGQGVDKNLQQQIQCEATKWKAILQRILDVTLFLSSRGLAFQGETSSIGDVHNGNFLGILELIGKYDDIAREHLAKIEKQQLEGRNMKGQAHYLSWYSQNEFISLCGDTLLQAILKQRETAIYYGIIVDATPDISHEEQNVLLLRFVNHDEKTNKFKVNERFIKFMNFNEKTGEAITHEIVSTLNELKISLDDCRAQGYDNGSNMRGDVKGVQSRILEKNNSAIFSPCGAHSLNRVGVNAAKMNADVMTFFGNLETLYSFFASSPARWEILKQNIPMSLQSLSQTRWSERIQAVRPIIKHYPGVLKVLDLFSENSMKSNLTPNAFNTIVGLKKYFNSFKGLVMTAFWHKVLACIDEINVVIQSKGITLNVECNLIKDLLDELQMLRDSSDDVISEVTLVATEVGISISSDLVQRQTAVIRKNKDGSGSGSTGTGEDTQEVTFKVSVMYSVLDFIMADIRTRFFAVENICDLFSPVLNFMDIEEEILKSKVKTLVQKFQNDLSEEIFEEILHMKKIYSTVFGAEKNVLFLLQSIYDKKLQSLFVNFCIALKLFCTVPVTVSSAERSFSKLANSLKTWQRNRTAQDRLNSLAVLAIENELAKSVDFSHVINQFAQKKARKVSCTAT